ncbi:MAG TPA: EF2563 family selenium-dependent molybdenum hydroxylase system protein [Candidatus Limivivens merdigallinarum]|uniref:EF2563 family selenium-dependent molybdenum hydroxylase system protein n=1 Tax=Candidatus Limivivens merdigallinarum TaxID=2840859 RepID=A0A9D1D2C2_9FIRM|nr:EF2563 family selenium-dependent molybdenum hydroxylase system protein [Candidatus Limivivens merdigallinarum]
MQNQKAESLVIVRGGGDLATGTIQKLYNAGFPVWVLECSQPTAIRRKVAFSEAVYDGEATVEGIRAVRVEDREQAAKEAEQGNIPVLIDGEARILQKVRPHVLVDAILAKRNLGTRRDMAEITIALGPGFRAGEDVDLVVETKRGHQLGRLIWEGEALPNTGIPGVIGGYGKERVIHAPAEGCLHVEREIGSLVQKGERLAVISGKEGETEVDSPLEGVLRGILRDGFWVPKGMKLADVDPRKEEQANCFTVSDKARCIAGGVLEGILALENRRGKR